MKAGPRVWPFAFRGVLGGVADQGGGGPGAAERGRHSAASAGGRIQGRVEFWPVGRFCFVHDQRKKWRAAEISPRPVIRGESPSWEFDQEQVQMADSSKELTRPTIAAVWPAGTDPLQVGTAKHKGKSVRVNLSVPADMDAILSGLAAKTGTSKASFVMQALRWYLPDLRVKLAEFDEVQAHIRRRQRLAGNGSAVEVSYERKLPREERRKLERDRLKAEKKQRLQGGQDGP